jgi:hypothetical protein
MAAVQVPVRRDIWTLESQNPWEPVTLAYARAVGRMRQLPASDPRSWSYQAAMHGSYVTPAKPNWNQCQHATWFFLPWHRMYIYWLERIVRSIVVQQGGPADWALPYWNYSRGAPANALPPAFRAARLPDGTANPLFTGQRRPAVDTGSPLSARTASFAAAFRLTRFSANAPLPSFGGPPTGFTHHGRVFGQLEMQPHNIVHDAVGGQVGSACGAGLMSDPDCAAQDPIFYLHHSNIDRLWSRWLDAGAGRANPADRAWLDQPFAFYDESGAQVTMTAARS